MVSQNSGSSQETTLANVRDDAVGVPKRAWYVAIVRHNTEKKLKEILEKEDIETFVASQMRLKITPAGRKKWVDRLLIAGKLFIRCNERERLKIVAHPYVYKFMTNPTKRGISGESPVAVISDKEIDTLRYMLGQKDYPVSLEACDYKKGDSVRIIRGALKGIEGMVFETNENQKEIGVLLDYFGCAKVSVPAIDVELLNKKN